MNSANTFAVFNIKQINRKAWGDGCLTASVRHCLRLITDRDQPYELERSHGNFRLLDSPATPEEVVALADRLLGERGYVPPRIDSTIAAEGTFSLRNEGDVPNMRLYFEDCARWLASNLDGTFLFGEVHLDEDYPHAHVFILLPLTSGGPSGSDLIGYTQSSRVRYASFVQEVASRHGMRAAPPKLTSAQKKVLARRVHQRIEDDPVRSSVLFAPVSGCIDRDPRPFAEVLGIPIPPSSGLAALAQSSGKGPRTAAQEAQIDAHIGRSGRDGGRSVSS